MKKEDIISAIDNFIQAEADNLVGFLSELIELKSLTGKEKAAVERAAAEMRLSGFDEVFLDSMGNAIGRVGQGPRILVYDAHLDIVDANPRDWDSDPFKGVVKDGNLYGRGALDDKGPFACLLYAAKAIKALGLDRDITLYVSGGVAEEDVEGLALQSFLSEYGIKPQLVLIAEASRLQICRGHRGRALFAAQFKGTVVHASKHETGVNPIEKALPFAQAVADLDKRLPDDNVLGKGDIVVTKIECQSDSLNSLPSSCKVVMDRRMNTLDSKQSALAELQSLPGAAEAKISILDYDQPGYNGRSMSCQEYFPSWAMDANDPAIQAATDCFRQLFKSEPSLEVWGFSTNGTYSKGEADIPTVGFGPGEPDLVHADNEHVAIEDLLKATRFYAYLPTCLKS